MSKEGSTSRKRNLSMLGKFAVVAVVMFGFAYALVPLYRQLCEVLGINVLAVQEGQGTYDKNTRVDRSRTVTVELDGNSHGPWRFRPVQSSLQVHPGELATVVYEVVNPHPRKMVAQAIPSYAPQSAAPYLEKVECFCFKQQELGPNEAKQYPVVFYIKPGLPKEVSTITLSYTFFEIAGATAQR